MLFEDRGETLLAAVGRLPALKALHITYHGVVQTLLAPVSDRNGLPRCEELASLHSRSLTRLSVGMLGDPEKADTLRLVGLPELRSCRLMTQPGVPRTYPSMMKALREHPSCRPCGCALSRSCTCSTNACSS